MFVRRTTFLSHANCRGRRVTPLPLLLLVHRLVFPPRSHFIYSYYFFSRTLETCLWILLDLLCFDVQWTCTFFFFLFCLLKCSLLVLPSICCAKFIFRYYYSVRSIVFRKIFNLTTPMFRNLFRNRNWTEIVQNLVSEKSDSSCCAPWFCVNIIVFRNDLLTLRVSVNYFFLRSQKLIFFIVVFPVGISTKNYTIGNKEILLSYNFVVFKETIINYLQHARGYGISGWMPSSDRRSWSGWTYSSIKSILNIYWTMFEITSINLHIIF